MRTTIIEKLVLIVIALIIILSMTACGKKVDDSHYLDNRDRSLPNSVQTVRNWDAPIYCIYGVQYIVYNATIQPKINREHITNPNTSKYTPCN